MYKTIRAYLLKNLENKKIDIYLDIRKTMDKLELTISNYPSRLRLSARGYIAFAKEKYIPSFGQAHMLLESIRLIVKQLGYADNMANVVIDSPSFNLESMLKYNYVEKKEKIEEILNEKGLKVHD